MKPFVILVPISEPFISISYSVASETLVQVKLTLVLVAVALRFEGLIRGTVAPVTKLLQSLVLFVLIAFTL